ncbi:MAG TPA: M28 family peptidase [Gemmatimonadales bacterium]|nr:M28 family peptidase [Gemmatimonadales bacterium]
MRRLIALSPVAVFALPLALAAQTSPALKSAAATITEADVRKRIFIIADDSMQGRDTPSRGLDLTAQYVADQFKKAGLKPGGMDGSWFVKYQVRRTRFDGAGSHVGFIAGGVDRDVSFTRDAFWRENEVPAGEVGGPAVVIGGALDPAAVGGLDLAGKTAILILDYSKPRPATVRPTLDALIGRAAAVVIVTNRDTVQLAQIIAQATAPRTDRVEPPVPGKKSAPVVEVHERAILDLLTTNLIQPDAIRSRSDLFVEPLPALKVMVHAREEVLSEALAPITVGVLEGTDPVLKKEYVAYSAHMDHVGVAGVSGQCRAVGADSICNGADDDGSGTVGVMELAEAFGQKGARPRRSMLFITVSGEEKGLWGSSYLVDHPPVPLAQVVADLNIDMIGRNWKDTIVAIGREHSDLGTTLGRVNAAHPELHMTAIDDRWPQENFYFRSDHYNFARKGVPILFFFNGTHEDYHQVSDSPDKLDAEKESRILQLLFYLGQEVANTTARPVWNPESYKKIVEGAK